MPSDEHDRNQMSNSRRRETPLKGKRKLIIALAGIASLAFQSKLGIDPATANEIIKLVWGALFAQGAVDVAERFRSQG
jgi:hypothetical protein